MNMNESRKESARGTQTEAKRHTLTGKVRNSRESYCEAGKSASKRDTFAEPALDGAAGPAEGRRSSALDTPTRPRDTSTVRLRKHSEQSC